MARFRLLVILDPLLQPSGAGADLEGGQSAERDFELGAEGGFGRIVQLPTGS